MPELPIALIVDPSDAYVSFQRRRFLLRWNVDPDKVEVLESLSAPIASTLFGETLFYTIRIERIDQAKKFNDEFAKLGAEAIKEKFADGLLIQCALSRNPTVQKLERLMKELGATISIPPGKGDEPVADKILSELSLPRSIKSMLTEFVGEDYDELLPIVEEFSKMPTEKQREVTEEEMFIRMPKSQGSVPPWDIEKYMFAGNITKMIQLSRRVSANASGIIWPLSIIRGKITLGHRIAALLAVNPRMTNNEIAETLGEGSGKISMTRRYTVGNHSLTAFQKALVIIDEAERNVKGGSAAPADTIFETALVRIAMIFKEDK